MTGRAGRVPRPRHFQAEPAEPSGQGTDTLFEHRGQVLLQGGRHPADIGRRACQRKEEGIMAEIITKDSDEFKELAGWINRAAKAVEDATARMRPAIADEHYLQGEDVCSLLHVSKRTLQTLRDEGAIPYTSIGGKILYPESALYGTLRKNYRNYRW